MIKFLSCLFFVAALMTACLIHAQSYIEFPDSNTTWIMAYQEDYDYNFEIEYSNASYFDIGDTVIGGIKYRKAYENNGFDITYFAAYRKVSADTVMIVPKDSSTEFLLYDFSIHAGDSVTVWDYQTYQGPGLITVSCLNTIDSQVIDGSLFKVLTVGFGTWYSGIGGFEGPFTTVYQYFFGGYPFIQCMSINGSPVFNPYNQCFAVGFDQTNSVSGYRISPNPTQTQLTINLTTPTNQVTIRVYDLQGRMIALPATFTNTQAQLNTEKLPDGFYTLQILNNKTGISEVGKFVKEK